MDVTGKRMRTGEQVGGNCSAPGKKETVWIWIRILDIRMKRWGRLKK